MSRTPWDGWSERREEGPRESERRKLGDWTYRISGLRFWRRHLESTYPVWVPRTLPVLREHGRGSQRLIQVHSDCDTENVRRVHTIVPMMTSWYRVLGGNRKSKKQKYMSGPLGRSDSRGTLQEEDFKETSLCSSLGRPTLETIIYKVRVSCFASESSVMPVSLKQPKTKTKKKVYFRRPYLLPYRHPRGWSQVFGVRLMSSGSRQSLRVVTVSATLRTVSGSVVQ